jgi:hypothetical protein
MQRRIGEAAGAGLCQGRPPCFDFTVAAKANGLWSGRLPASLLFALSDYSVVRAVTLTIEARQFSPQSGENNK